MITIWARAELDTGLVAASIPPLKAVFESFLQHFFDVTSRTPVSRAGGAYGTNSSLRHSRMSRRSQHRILPEDTSSQTEFAMVNMKFRQEAKETEADTESLQRRNWEH